jgi:hypothetical protein
MAQRLNIVLCASGHLPSGTSEAEFEAFYNTEIKSLILALDKFPQINMVFHYSGVILYWIERRHPEFFMLLEDLLSRKQIEFLGGGFYDPVLPLIPLSDKIGQIEMLTTYLRKRFGKRPQGCWLPAMAWEQNLVGPLNSCGMNYTFLEDLQFSGAGVKPNAAGIYSPCITEDLGKLITVFPLAGKTGCELRKGEPSKILEELSEKLPESDESETVVIPIGGEVIGENRNETDYEFFFRELSNVGNRIKYSTAARIIKNLKGLKKVYFPGVWTLEHHTGKETHPRQFLANRPEAGGIYAKMIYVHALINNQLRGDKSRKRTALEELWKAQDSGIYRLGTVSSPGLLYFPVRKAAYSALLEAEKITREKSKFTPSLSVFDFDLDGEGEYIFQDDKLNYCVKSRGAGIFELDYLSASWNYLDTLAVKNGYLDGGKRRCAFVDWLAPAETLPEDTGPEGIRGGRFCGDEDFEVSEIDRVHRRVTFRLPPKAGFLWGEIEISKTWQLKKNSLSLEYVLRNTGTNNSTFSFCPSLDLSFPGAEGEFLRINSTKDGEKEEITFNGSIVVRGVKTLEFHDLKNRTLIALETNRGFDGRIFSVCSVLSDREEYQSTCVMPLLSLSLEAGKIWKAAFSLKISS